MKMSFEEMFNIIDAALEGESYGVGIHGVASERNGIKREEMMSSMLKNGINISEGNSVLATISSIGTTTKLESNHKKTISTYSFGREEGKYNLLIAVPSQIKIEQEGVYLGFPEANTDIAGNQYKTTCVLDYLCCGNEKKGTIPKEFILGYYIDGSNTGENAENKQVTFVKNEKHYSNLSDEEKKELLTTLQEKLDGKYKLISDAVMTSDTQALDRLFQEENEYNREIYLQKRHELLEQGIVNDDMVKAFAEKYEISAVRQAKNYVREKHLEAPNIHTIGTRRKIPIGLLVEDSSENSFIKQCREQTYSIEEIATYDSANKFDKSKKIEEKTRAEVGPVL